AFVDKKAWDPDWEQVLLFLAGMLDDPGPLLDVLAERGQDDFFRHRLALAARCLAELPRAVRQRQTGRIDRITTDLAARWWECQRPQTADAATHFAPALAALGEVNGRVRPGAGAPVPAHCPDGQPLVDWAAGLLEAPDPEMRRRGVEAVRSLGGA